MFMLLSAKEEEELLMLLSAARSEFHHWAACLVSFLPLELEFYLTKQSQLS